ncbi:MAG: DUF1553 domain-containing protein, partial [Verrucomicrobiae bacterium]|nr:DUF1553 domain-containing protein [Verrucomicrobiae bacterium]
GINMKCASCHDSFIDRWKLQDAYSLAAVFSTEPVEVHRCDKGTGEIAKAAWIFPELGNVIPEAPQPERLAQLARLMTHPDNGRFTRTLVNRIWHRLMGRGIVHPVDAMHTQPWSEDLLDWLAADFSENDYDLKRLIRRIASSRAYQAPMAATPSDAAAEAYVYHGPIARRMTAEQFIDAVWTITGTAPSAPAADVLRMKIEPGQFENIDVEGKWIWSNREGTPEAGETVTMRGVIELSGKPEKAFGAVTADNEYALFVNGRKVRDDTNWETVEAVDLTGFLKEGKNEILIGAKNGGNGPNAASAFFEMRAVLAGSGVGVAGGTDESWKWTSQALDAKGKFAKPVGDWAPVRILDGKTWSAKTMPQIRAALARSEGAGGRMVRASLMKSDLLMRSLGRPNREQVVTVRPEHLSTLQAIDLANGEILSATLKRGAANLLASHQGADPATLIVELYRQALSRSPRPDEAKVLSEVMGSSLTGQGIEDALWSVMMLPEFQLVR